MDEQQIDVGGQRIAYAQSEGRGRPVIFVHGNSSSARTWQQVMAGPFGQRFRCLAFDLPGHGNSASPTNREDYSLPGYARPPFDWSVRTPVNDRRVKSFPARSAPTIAPLSSRVKNPRWPLRAPLVTMYSSPASSPKSNGS